MSRLVDAMRVRDQCVVVTSHVRYAAATVAGAVFTRVLHGRMKTNACASCPACMSAHTISEAIPKVVSEGKLNVIYRCLPVCCCMARTNQIDSTRFRRSLALYQL